MILLTLIFLNAWNLKIEIDIRSENAIFLICPVKTDHTLRTNTNHDRKPDL